MPPYYKAIITMKFKLNICQRYGKAVKFISGLTKYVNAYKILIVLLSCLFIKSGQVLKDNNISNFLNVLSNNS